jgi:hypothetical protein
MHQSDRECGQEGNFGWLREGQLKRERECMIIAQDKSISPLGLHDEQAGRRRSVGIDVPTAMTAGYYRLQCNAV